MANNSSTIITRSAKGTPLAYTEVDANFTNLNTDKVAASGGSMSGGAIDDTTIGATTRSSGKFTTLDANGNVILGDASGDTVTVNGTVTPASSSAIGLLVSGTSSGAMLKVTQQGTGDAFVVEDVASDSTPFKIDQSGNVTIGGNLTVQGTTTTISSTTLDVTDLNITVAKGSGSSSAADGAGLTVDIGGSNPTLVYTHSGTKFTSSLDFDLASGKVYKINNTEVLSASALTIGSLGYSASGAVATLTSTVAGYNQLVVRNLSSNASASADIVVNNNQSTDTTYYGDFGMNSSAWSGTGFSTANAVYLTATTAPLILGTTTDHGVEIWTGATPVQSLSIAATTGITTLKELALTTKLAVAQGGTGGSSAGITLFNNITGYTASGATGTTSTNLVFSTSPTLTTPSLAATPGSTDNGTAVASTAFVRLYGGFQNMVVLTSGSGATGTIPTGISKIKVTMIGGGGAGGGGAAAIGDAGAGGGSGAMSIAYLVSASLSGATYTYTVGTAGAGASGAVGGNGGASSFSVLSNTFTAPGGTGGALGAAVSTPYAGGAGGTAGSVTAGAYTSTQFLVGTAGGFSWGTAAAGTCVGGMGGSGLFGQGAGRGAVGATVATAATANTGAGGGGSASTTAAATTGGNGGSGVIIIEY
jgi:hypothetical protein